MSRRVTVTPQPRIGTVMVADKTYVATSEVLRIAREIAAQDASLACETRIRLTSRHPASQVLCRWGGRVLRADTGLNLAFRPGCLPSNV